MQELLINEGQLIHQRTELEIKQKQLCELLNSPSMEFDESQFLFSLRKNKESMTSFQISASHLPRSIERYKIISKCSKI